MISADVVKVLKDVAGRDGGAVLGNRRRLLGLLRDKLPSEVRTIQWLMTAFDEGVPARLKANASLGDAALVQETTRLMSNVGMAPEFARAAVAAWAEALTGYVAAAPEALASDWIEAPSSLPAPAVMALPPLAAAVPVQPAASAATTATASAATPPAAAPGRGQRIGNIIRIVAAVIVMLGGIAQIARSFGVFSGEGGGGSGTTVETTADGTPILEGAKMPTIVTQRFGNGGEIMGYDFAIRQGAGVFAYSVAMRFDGPQKATAIVVASKDGKSASSGSIAATRTANGEKSQTVQLLGQFSDNPVNAAPICVVQTLAPNPNRPDVQGGSSSFCATAVSASGSCDTSNKLGCAHLN